MVVGSAPGLVADIPVAAIAPGITSGIWAIVADILATTACAAHALDLEKVSVVISGAVAFVGLVPVTLVAAKVSFAVVGVVAVISHAASTAAAHLRDFEEFGVPRSITEVAIAVPVTPVIS